MKHFFSLSLCVHLPLPMCSHSPCSAGASPALNPWAPVPPSVGVSRKAVQRSLGWLSNSSGCGTLGPAGFECIQVRNFTIIVFTPLAFCGLDRQPLDIYSLSYPNIFTKSMPPHHCLKYFGSFKAVPGRRKKEKRKYRKDFFPFFNSFNTN